MTGRWEDRIEYEIHPPDPKVPRGRFVVLAHPHPLFGGTLHNKVIDQVFRRSSERGWGVLRFNFRGAGNSTGTHDQGIGETEDLVDLIHRGPWFPDGASLTLVGYSFGAWVLERAQSRVSRPIASMVLVAPPVGRYAFPSGPRKAIPTTVFAAERDELIPLEATKAWFASLPEPKALRIVADADHHFIGTTTALIRGIFETLEAP